jgi:alkylation response protein AidB-like acyl-CoA dehydrogenase
VHGVIEEFGRLMADVWAPTNALGDQEGSHVEGDEVVTAPGFKEAYQAYAEAGWGAVPFAEEYGGGGFPWLVGIVMQELLNSANMALAMAPLLTQGAIDAISHHGSEEQKEKYLPKMVSAEWTGTMNLTEPDAGSDVGALRTKAVKQDDGTYRITGQKIYITFGEHSFTDNIVHLVLARTPDAPTGTKGISLFIVPKFLVNDDGSLGERNDVHIVSVEHKMGIKASPTCVLAYGDNSDGAVGYLIGEENAGMRYMFTMMNNARLGVGVEGLGLAERSLPEGAVQYARRTASRGTPRVPPAARSRSIIEHPDVRRMLLTMKAYTESMRLMCFKVAEQIDVCATAPTSRTHRSPGDGRPADPAHEELLHRPRRDGHLDRHPGPRWHGLHRGDRRRPVLPRHQDHPDLRGHQRHPGHGPRRPQAPHARRWRVPGPGGPHAATSRSWPAPATSSSWCTASWPPPSTPSRTPPAGSSPRAWPTRCRRSPPLRPTSASSPPPSPAG